MMNIWINTVGEIGEVVRAARKAQGVRQDDLAGSVGVSHVYMRDLEHGKETAQMGRALKVLEELGVRVALEMPDDVYERLTNDREKARRLVKNPLREQHRVVASTKEFSQPAKVERK